MYGPVGVRRATSLALLATLLALSGQYATAQSPCRSTFYGLPTVLSEGGVHHVVQKQSRQEFCQSLGYSKAGGYRAATLDVLEGSANATDIGAETYCWWPSCKWLIAVECIPAGARKCSADSRGNIGRDNFGYRNFGVGNHGISNFGNHNWGNHLWGNNNTGEINLGIGLSGQNSKPKAQMIRDHAVVALSGNNPGWVQRPPKKAPPPGRHNLPPSPSSQSPSPPPPQRPSDTLSAVYSPLFTPDLGTGLHLALLTVPSDGMNGVVTAHDVSSDPPRLLITRDFQAPAGETTFQFNFSCSACATIAESDSLAVQISGASDPNTTYTVPQDEAISIDSAEYVPWVQELTAQLSGLPIGDSVDVSFYCPQPLYQWSKSFNPISTTYSLTEILTDAPEDPCSENYYLVVGTDGGLHLTFKMII